MPRLDAPFFRRLLLPLVLVFALPLPVWAAESSRLPDAPSPSSSVDSAGGSNAGGATGGIALRRRHIVIPSLDAVPTLRDFLGTSLTGAARSMMRITNFVQRYPDDGQIASQPTTAYLGYTHDALFVAFVCS